MTTLFTPILRRLTLVGLSVVAAVTVFSGECGAAIYTVGASGTGCTHTTIQAAINAAVANPGVDTVRITRSLSYAGQHIVVNDNQNLNIVGGFAACTSTVSDGQKTVISASGAMAYKVFSIANTDTSTVTMQLLRVTGGNAGSGYGGGIYFLGGGNLQLIEMAIDNNSANYGGGIYFEGNSNTAKLIISNDNLINGNTANISGGGIYLQHGDMAMTAPGSSIAFNSAVNYGGGLRLYGTNGPIGTRATVGSNGYSNIPAIYGNSARWGAGVAVQGLESDGVGSGSFTLNGGASIAGNFASESGGAIYLQNYYGFNDFGDVDAVVSGILDSNSAPQAAAVFVGHDTDGLGLPRGSQFSMTGSLVGNLAVDSNNNPTGGAIVVATEKARANFSRTLIQGNVGGAILRADQSDSAVPLSLNHSLISGNTLQRDVVEISNSGPINIRGSTIAGNTIAGTTVISAAGSVTIEQSIIWQPGKQTANLGGSSSLDDIIASELPSIGGGGTSIIYADPRFIDPAHGDYHLQAASPAVDFAGVTSTTDLAGNLHNKDMTLVANRYGVGDIGAYELQSIGNLVLDPGFAVDLRLWNVVTPGVSTWNSSGSSSAGSVVIFQDPAPTGEMVALSQCVHIPGPGSYELNGFAYGAGPSNVQRDKVRLGWKLRPNPGGEACNGSVPAEGEVTFPGSSTWVTSTTPAIITIPPALWSRYSSVEVSLIVQEAGLTINGTTTGYFDGITLQAIDISSDRIFADSFE
ncbi:MAG: hypothetical protein ABI411_17205 [Tahibacter sp.]